MQLTIRDVAKLLRASEREIYRWIDEDELPAYRMNDQYRFNRAELLEWATTHKVAVAPGLFARAATSPVLSLAGSLGSAGVFRGITGADKASVLRALVETLPLPPSMNREHLLHMILAREALSSTGIGDGIAVPHVRNPIIFPVREPIVALFFLERPVEFGALDGKPVHSLFAIVSPTVRTHLQLLSRLAFCLRDPGLRALIQKRGSQEEIVSRLRSVESSFPPNPC